MESKNNSYRPRYWAEVRANIREFYNSRSVWAWVSAGGVPALGVLWSLFTGDIVGAIGGLAVAGVIFLVVLLIAMIVTPSSLDQSAQKSIAELQASLETTEIRLREIRTPKLEILFEEGGSFQLSGEFRRQLGENLFSGPLGTQTLHRVAIRNLSKTESVANVSLELQSMEPDAIKSLPVPLHPMHGFQSRTLGPDETKYFDLVTFYSFTDPGSNNAKERYKYRIHHTIDGMSDLVPDSTTYAVTLTARGSQVPPVHRRFRIGLKQDLKYSVWPVNDAASS